MPNSRPDLTQAALDLVQRARREGAAALAVKIFEGQGEQVDGGLLVGLVGDATTEGEIADIVRHYLVGGHQHVRMLVRAGHL